MAIGLKMVRSMVPYEGTLRMPGGLVVAGAAITTAPCWVALKNDSGVMRVTPCTDASTGVFGIAQENTAASGDAVDVVIADPQSLYEMQYYNAPTVGTVCALSATSSHVGQLNGNGTSASGSMFLVWSVDTTAGTCIVSPVSTALQIPLGPIALLTT